MSDTREDRRMTPEDADRGAGKHTPGPWNVCQDGKCSCKTVSWAHHPIAKAYAGDWGDEYPAIRLIPEEGNMKAEAYMERIVYGSIDEEVAQANARLIAAAPTMADAIKGLIGLCQLVRNRDDCPSEIRQALTHNHRIIAGYEALSAAGIEGFQPSDFDAHKQAESRS